MPDFLSTSKKKLDKSVDGWGRSIMSDLTSWGLPPGSKISMGWRDRDETSGTGAGTITIAVGGVPVNVPVIVRDFKLYPVDVMEINGKYAPFTKSRLSAVHASGAAYEGPVPPSEQIVDRDQDISAIIVPPSYQSGMRKFQSENSTIVSQLVRVPGNPWHEEFFTSMTQDLARQYKANGTHDVLKIVLNKQNGDIAIADAAGGPPKLHDPDNVNVMWVPPPDEESVRNGMVTVLAASGRRFDPALIRLPLSQMKALYSNTSGIDPAMGGDVYVDLHDGEFRNISGVNASSDDYKNVFGVSKKSVEDLKSRRHRVFVGTRDLEMVDTKCVFSVVHDPENGVEGPGVLTNNGTLVLGQDFYATAKDSESYSCKGSKDVGGEMSELFVDDDEGIAVGPVRVKNRESYKIGAGDGAIDAVAMICKDGIKIVKSDAFKDVAFGDKTVYLPTRYYSRTVRRVTETAHPSQANFIAKAAAAESGTWLRLYSTDGGVSVTLDMPEKVKLAYEPLFEKVAGMDFDGLPPRLAEFVITAAGVHPQDAKNLVKEAQSSPVTAYGVDYHEPARIVKRSAEYDHQLKALKRDFAEKIFCNLMKEAAAIDDHDSVDAMLSLGLADEHNVDEYIESIPKYQEVVEELAAMLPSARMVGGPFTEEAIRKAMVAIENFLEQAEAYLAAKKSLDGIRAS